METWIIFILCRSSGAQLESLVGRHKQGEKWAWLDEKCTREEADLRWALQVMGSLGVLGENGESSKPAAGL